MEKKFEEEEKLKQMSEEEKKKEHERLEELKKKHAEHPKLNHPVSALGSLLKPLFLYHCFYSHDNILKSVKHSVVGLHVRTCCILLLL